MSEFNSKFIKYLCLLLFLKGCAYFNSFYNAEENIETAERIRIENLGAKFLQGLFKSMAKQLKNLKKFYENILIADM